MQSDFWTPIKHLDKYSIFYSRCNDAMDPAERARIVADLERGLPGYGIRQYWDRQPGIFQDYDACAIARNLAGETVGLVGGRFISTPGKRAFYIWTAQVAAALHGTSLLPSLAVHFFARLIENHGCPDVIALKTYSPRVYSLFHRFYGMLAPGVSLYPDLHQAQQEARMLEIAGALAAVLCPGLPFEPDHGIIRGGQDTVAPAFFATMPASRDRVVQRFFERHVTRSDQVMCLIDMPGPARDRCTQVIFAMRDASREYSGTTRA
jgi:hypothetical protein